MSAAGAWFRSHWKFLLIVIVSGVALGAIFCFERDYGELQTASDADAFRGLLDHPQRAIGAALGDVLFAAGYGVLGAITMRAVGGRTGLATIGVTVVVAAALFDELENALLIGNISRRDTVTDGWIDAMTTVGCVKWSCVYVSLALFILLVLVQVIARVRRRRRPPVRTR